MPGSGLILWPRQEVFQLVIPQLGSTGTRHLTFSAALNVIKKLSKVQSTEGTISFDRWLIVAKDTLKWNDYCIQLFWEMLVLATSYVRNDLDSSEDIGSSCEEMGGIDLEYVAIFLVLHMGDHQNRPSSPIIAYDTVWPSVNSEGEASPSSPQGSPTDKGKKQPNHPNSQRLGSPVSSPRSPSSNNRSPRRKGNSSSPSKRSSSHLFNSSGPRSSAQYLHAARQKIPIILKALCIDPDIDFGLDNASLSRSDSFHLNRSNDSYDRFRMERSNSGDRYQGKYDPNFRYSADNYDNTIGGSPDFEISKKTMDALGLILCGGFSREEHVTIISQLHSQWCKTDASSSSNNSAAPTDRIRGLKPEQATSDQSAAFMQSLSGCLMFSDISSWIDRHLSINDMLYPVAVSTVLPSNASVPGSPSGSPKQPRPGSYGLEGEDSSAGGVGGIGGGMGGLSKHGEGPAAPATLLSARNQFQHPSRTVTAVSSLSRFVPTVINTSSTTTLHVATCGPTRAPTRTSKGNVDNMTLEGADIESESAREENSESGSVASINGTMVESGPESGSESSSNSLMDVQTSKDKMQVSVSTDRFHELKDESADDGSGSDAGMSLEKNVVMNEGGDSGASVSQASNGNIVDGSSSSLSKAASGNDATDPAVFLPQLFLNFCNRGCLYLISPFYSASITGCTDCTIVVGAVYGAVVVSGCERVKLTCACRKLVVLNCLECEFNIATLSGTVISGDSRSLTFGPFNTAYRDLKQHLKLASLQALITPPADPAAVTPIEPSTMPGATISSSGSSGSNCWSVLCDVNTALEAVTSTSSPSGYAMDAITGCAADSLLPPPPVSTASIKPYDQFQPVLIPFKTQYACFQTCPIDVARGYIDNIKEREDDISRIKQQISSMVSAGQEASQEILSSSQETVNMMENAKDPPVEDETDGDSDSNADAARIPPHLVAKSMISKKFMAWLAASGQLHEVLDLIRIDNENSQKGGKSGPVFSHNAS